eukprot:4186770-Heterocapsa_arctica.AAC.1
MNDGRWGSVLHAKHCNPHPLSLSISASYSQLPYLIRVKAPTSNFLSIETGRTFLPRRVQWALQQGGGHGGLQKASSTVAEKVDFLMTRLEPPATTPVAREGAQGP